MKLSEMTKRELKEEYIAVWETVYKIGCYGTKDLRWLDAVEKEIHKRGMEIEAQCPEVV